MDEEFVNLYIEKLNQRITDLTKNETIMITHLESANKKLQILDGNNVNLGTELETVRKELEKNQILTDSKSDINSNLMNQIETLKFKLNESNTELRQSKTAVSELQRQVDNELRLTQEANDLAQKYLDEIVTLTKELELKSVKTVRTKK